ncbi:(5-formylfuran-3-yl)methyl phosphate synthase [Candidatus Pyrohabitans sp.]
MKLLVSPVDAAEAEEAVRGGADIIDVKNPAEGSLGASFPWVIREIMEVVPRGVETSATLGDLSFKPGTASLAAYGLASLGVDYLKAGFYGISTPEQALVLSTALVRAAEGFDARVIIAGYADHAQIGAISPFALIEAASKAGAAGVMIDTALKGSGGLLAHYSFEELVRFVEEAHSHGLICALAGSLSAEDLPEIKKTGVDIAGIRGAACTDGDRARGRVVAERVKFLKSLVGP